jgi:c-di-GMP-binding flagellar brake protein YcgR
MVDIDISYGGAGIVGTKKLPAEGAELAVSILLAGSSIKLPARVVWVNSKASKLGLADFGVEFLESFPERQGKLARFIPQHNAVED